MFRHITATEKNIWLDNSQSFMKLRGFVDKKSTNMILIVSSFMKSLISIAWFYAWEMGVLRQVCSWFNKMDAGCNYVIEEKSPPRKINRYLSASLQDLYSARTNQDAMPKISYSNFAFLIGHNETF